MPDTKPRPLSVKTWGFRSQAEICIGRLPSWSDSARGRKLFPRRTEVGVKDYCQLRVGDQIARHEPPYLRRQGEDEAPVEVEVIVVEEPRVYRDGGDEYHGRNRSDITRDVNTKGLGSGDRDFEPGDGRLPPEELCDVRHLRLLLSRRFDVCVTEGAKRRKKENILYKDHEINQPCASEK